MKRIISSKSKGLAILSVLAFTFFVSILILKSNVQAEDVVDNGIKKAVIIYQLHDDIPNETFVQLATNYLEGAGYKVDYYSTNDITVDFYKELPKLNYQYIVVRSHGVADF